MKFQHLCLVLVLCTFSFSVNAIQQQSLDSIPIQELQEITINATRVESNSLTSPYAVTSISQSQIQTAQQQLSINDALNLVPGLFALNPDNFAQDSRVSIRGFGARAAFGIRGIKLLVDGLPESTPDGQGQVDNLDIGMLQSIEVIRGTSSGLYGNASGGVISFRTEEPTENPFLEARIATGAFGFQQYQLKTGQKKDKFSYLLHGTHTQTNGYRDQSGMKSTLLNTKFGYDINDKSKLTLLVNYVNSPQADDPGGINLEAVMENRRQARDRNVLFKGGEELQQGRVGLIYDNQISENQAIQIKGYHTFRDFENRLPFEFGGIVAFQRAFSGGGFNYKFSSKGSKMPYRLQAGVDIENQRDNRQRFKNLEGVKGDMTLDQKEEFFNVGFYLVQELELTLQLKANLGTRFDAVRLKATDAFISNGDDSGEITLNNFSPMFGLTYSVSKAANIYANISTNFETPALSELSNNPSGEGGFNPDLQQQRATGMELGIKGLVSSKLRYELALFNINIQNEIVPFELEDFPGRSFYRNAGASNRKGLETSLTYRIASGLNASATYTYSDFVYKEYIANGDDLEGNILPGIPKHSGVGMLRYFHKSGVFASLRARFVGELYTNDSNTVTDTAYQVMDLQLAYQKQFSNWLLEPFLGVNNLLNEKYNANIRINAFGSRFFEPAAERYIFGGVRIRIGKG